MSLRANVLRDVILTVFRRGQRAGDGPLDRRLHWDLMNNRARSGLGYYGHCLT